MRFKHAHISRLVPAVVCCALLWGGAGCEIATVPEPLTAKLGADDADTQLDFWHELADRPMASNDDAAHALLLFTDGTDAGPDYVARVAALKSRKMLPGHFDAPANEAVQRGPLAYALARALDIRGGITMHVFGNSQRYATRELVDLGIFPLSSPNQTFSGTELVGIFGKAEDYRRGGGGEKVAGSLATQAPIHNGVQDAVSEKSSSPPASVPPGSMIAPQIPVPPSPAPIAPASPAPAAPVQP